METAVAEIPSKSLVIGAGEIGTAIHGVLKSKKKPADIRDVKEPKEQKSYDILHIAIPYTDKFISSVQGYIEQYNPKLAIVYSSTPIGTCEKISEVIVHSPVEGRHPKLKESILVAPRWLGSSDEESLFMALEFWKDVGVVVRPALSSRFTEMLKMRSTAKYGVNLVWTDYEKQLADSVGADWNMVKLFDFDYNYLYEVTGWPQFSRYILDPPEGVIGGHCVVPNAELLNADHPHPMLDMIIEMKKGEEK